ncbi:MAG: ShlB/FhaC/HecB family hemolysin secretion/activation protein [Methylacidiphilales bacterium]|nr:ShlB/FhaC/HecB family hemolysin secretion/activation protein [Candidatus Methylacidiphilales bacterium]
MHSSLNAQLASDPAQQQLRQERLKADEERRFRPTPQVSAPAQEPSPLSRAPSTGPKFPIDTITIENLTVLQTKALSPILTKYQGTEMGLADIDRLINELTNFLIEKGYITTRVYIPPQNIATTRTLRLVVVEGKIEEIVLNQNRWPDRLKAFMALPLHKNQILHLRHLEQGVDQLNRVPSAQAQVKLEPGSKPGYSIINITNRPRKAYRFGVGYDNHGQSITGRNRIRLSTEFDNALNLNETFSIFYLGSQNTNALGASFSAPFRWWTLQSSAAYSEYLVGITPGVELFGSSFQITGGIQRMLYRDSRQKLSLGLDLEVKESARVINDIILLPQPLTALKLSAMHSYRFDKAQLTSDLTFSQGLPILGAKNDPSSLSWKDPHREFTKFEIGISNLLTIQPWLSWRALIRAQYSLHGLYGSEQLFLADITSVRGFSSATAIGDDGIYARNELTFSPPPLTKIKTLDWLLTKFSPYLFLDSGYASLKTQDSGTRLTSGGAGIRFQWEYLQADVAYAHALDWDRKKQKLSRNHEVYFSMGMNLKF